MSTSLFFSLPSETTVRERNMDIGRTCDLCDHEEFEEMSRRDRLGKPLSTVVCKHCGLVSHARIPTCEELCEYYTNEYRREYHGEYRPAAHRVVREWNRGQRLVEQLRSKIPAGQRVFEVGSGIGCTVMNFALAGYDASGVEPGEGFRKFSTDTLHANVIAGFLNQVPARQQFDAVLLVHVLEHLPSPTQALTQIRGLLREGGKLYIEVPNFACPHAAPGKQFHFAHIYNYTPATLRMCAAKTGFKINHVYSDPFDRNTCFLLEACQDAKLRIEPQSYAQSLAAQRRYSTLTYHLRWEYLHCTTTKLWNHWCDHWQAQRKMNEIVERCQAPSQHKQKAVVPLRRAAAA